jgi:hypothetical protein
MSGRFLSLLLVAATACLAQPAESTATRRQVVPATSDTARRYPAKAPGTAVLLSFLIPAGGQLYTHRWWQAAIIAPAEVALGYLAVREHLGVQDALAAGNEAAYVRHRDRRTTLLWFTGAAVVFSMAHAYVSAQMYGFDRQMTFSIGPAQAGLRVGI